MWVSAEFIQKTCWTSELSSNVILGKWVLQWIIFCVSLNCFEVLSSRSSHAASEVIEYSDKDSGGQGSRFTSWLCHFQLFGFGQVTELHYKCLLIDKKNRIIIIQASYINLLMLINKWRYYLLNELRKRIMLGNISNASCPYIANIQYMCLHFTGFPYLCTRVL